MTGVSNRSPWVVFVGESTSPEATFASGELAKAFIEELKAKGLQGRREQLKAGPWQGRVRRTGLPAFTKSFATKKEAREWKTSREAEYLRRELEDYRVADRTTLRELLLSFRDALPLDKLGDKSEYHRLGKIARNQVAEYSLSKLRPSHIAAYRDERLSA